jgi:hypothetical protein
MLVRNAFLHMFYGQIQCYYNVIEEKEEEKKEIKRKRRGSAFEIARPVQTLTCTSIKLFVCSVAIFSVVFRCRAPMTTHPKHNYYQAEL